MPHQRTFNRVWIWVGQYRKTGKNFGVDAYRIPEEVKLLCDDCAFWRDNGVYSPDEMAARFHHRLVLIHCYPNGNGRHARLAADVLLRSMGCERFTWGALGSKTPKELRAAYIKALRDTDDHDYQASLHFVRS